MDNLLLVSDRLESPVELELIGEALGDVTVGAGVTFILTGAVRGNVVALKGSAVIINGFVAGEVVNHDAFVRIEGLVASLVDSTSRPAIIAPEANIRNRAGFERHGGTAT